MKSKYQPRVANRPGSLKVSRLKTALVLITNAQTSRQQKADFSTELAYVQLSDGLSQMWTALQTALFSIPGAGNMTRDEKVAASEASLRQFSDAYMTYIPTYLDWLSAAPTARTKTSKRAEADALKILDSMRVLIEHRSKPGLRPN